MMRLTLLLILALGLLAPAINPAYGQQAEATFQTDETPDTYRLTPPYPNPFNPQTQFTLTVSEAQHVIVEVYNMLGRRVEVLHDGRLTAEQAYTFTFEAGNEPSGIYLIRVTGEQFTTTQRITLLK